MNNQNYSSVNGVPNLDIVDSLNRNLQRNNDLIEELTDLLNDF